MQLADQFSRPHVDIDDWGVDQESLQMVTDKLSEPVVDLFASDANHRFPLFYSDLASVNAIGVNAFTGKCTSSPWGSRARRPSWSRPS